ncbi:hypothetical protein RIVM261_075930 [Rivularia sp. IAM M-261]|nr:hypothetical protein RIVM261_075930 [Rivularia sp. IAM M-261]
MRYFTALFNPSPLKFFALLYEGIGRGFDIFKKYVEENGIDSLTCKQESGIICVRLLRRRASDSNLVVNTDILELFKSLQSKNNDFQIEFQPLNSSYFEKIVIEGKFQVISVRDNDWNKFQSGFRNTLSKRKELLDIIAELQREIILLERQTYVESNEVFYFNKRINQLEATACGIDLLREDIERKLKSRLCTFSEDEFRKLDSSTLILFERLVNDWLNQDKNSIKDLYGLEVEVSQIIISVTESEESKRRKCYAIETLDRRRHSKLEQIHKLEKKVIELTGLEGADDEIETVEARLEKLYYDMQNLNSDIIANRFNQFQTASNLSSEQSEIEPFITVHAEVENDYME